MSALFWTCIAVVAYVYVGYPLILRGWARLRPRPHTADLGQMPAIAIVIAARNEGTRLGARIDNLLRLDYPPDRRQIIVVCDGCTDDTERVLARYTGVVESVTMPASGKAASLNAGVRRARGEIVVFADARQVFARGALRELVAPFSDPTVGAVTGELLLDCESALFSNRRANADRRRLQASRAKTSPIERRTREDRRRTILSTIADGVGFYWRYEKQLRRLESCVGSTLGATGAIYAMRRALWRPLPLETLLDDVLAPMRVVLAGFRVVLNDRARAYDRAPADADAESRRKIRTLAGNYQILQLEPRLLLPWRNPVWFQYLSHKIGRLAVPYAILGIFASSITLSTEPFYRGALWIQVAFYLLAGYGAVLELTSRADARVRAPRAASAGSRAATREVA
jgi:biofilm PGA synthesis N-glycosyltransferase PgaC